ncbi:aldo/keto reductase [Aeromicrobium camelliae]|uniref:Aldo/keto reductase n=1 Tax=Aeromicrobium camelliae TaxID=1538144 RepID=A0A3N6W3F2_9ACTN|nr:aldo/keto reductase [Aeromicrobium camelliae]RQN02056.1 aldo/keto reductase [Aeromicrobium camelliae]
MSTFDLGPLVLGGNTFGWTADRDQSFAVLDAFVAAGGTTIDTADVYSAWVPGNSGGDSETIIGEWLASRGLRERVQIATKVGMWDQQPGLSAANVRAAIEGSLRRLQTDYVDLYYAHQDDENVTPDEISEVFDALVQEGKVRALGLSNFSAERLRAVVEAADAAGRTPFSVSQDHYNLVERGFEQSLAPTLAELGLVEAPYYSLASGFLTGKYRPGSAVDSPRQGGAAAYLDDPRNLDLLVVLERIAKENGLSITAVSLAWLRQQPTVAAPIASARTPEQLVALVESFALTLSADELDALS